MIPRTSLILSTAVLVLLVTGATALVRGWIPVQPQWLPWKPLDVADPPNLWTRYKLSRLSTDAAACRSVLRSTALEFERLTDRETGADCGFTNAVLVRRIPAAVGEPFSLTCRAAVSLALWERHSLQPAATKNFGQRVIAFEHSAGMRPRRPGISRASCSRMAGASGSRATGETPVRRPRSCATCATAHAGFLTAC
jgi:hypothetical protein